jgi:hypothetical protein
LRSDAVSRLTATGSCLLVLASGWPASGTAPAQTARTVIAFHGARWIPGDGDPAVENAVLLAEDGVITRVGPPIEVAIPEGAERVDLSGKTVMPMLVSLHAHLGWAKEATFAKENFTADNVAHQLRQLERLGIGAVLSLGTDAGEVEFGVRHEQRARGWGGALFHTAGRGFVAPEGGPPTSPLEHVPYEVGSVGEALDRLRELAGKHPDMVKIWVDDRAGTKPNLAPEIYRAVIGRGSPPRPSGDGARLLPR